LGISRTFGFGFCLIQSKNQVMDEKIPVICADLVQLGIGILDFWVAVFPSQYCSFTFGHSVEDQFPLLQLGKV
jgi:hypothetical protein